MEKLYKIYLGGEFRKTEDHLAISNPYTGDIIAKACKAGEAAYCRQMAIMNGVGEGIAKNPVKSHLFYRRACELGDGFSCQKEKIATKNKNIRKLKARSLLELLDSGKRLLPAEQAKP